MTDEQYHYQGQRLSDDESRSACGCRALHRHGSRIDDNDEGITLRIAGPTVRFQISRDHCCETKSTTRTVSVSHRPRSNTQDNAHAWFTFRSVSERAHPIGRLESDTNCSPDALGCGKLALHLKVKQSDRPCTVAQQLMLLQCMRNFPPINASVSAAARKPIVLHGI